MYIHKHTGKTYEHRVPDNETQAHTHSLSLSLHNTHTQARHINTAYPMTRRRHTHTPSLYIYIRTHTGKTNEHRVPDDEAQAWLDALIFTVKEAKAKTSRSIFGRNMDIVRIR